MLFESENVEFESVFTADLYKEVVAFANNGGGVIYIGIDDSGNEIGVTDVDETYTKITNGIRDAISPDVTIFCKYSLNENHVITIEISEGARKPYYLKSKGIKPGGVYVRQGASSVPASEDQIRMMIKMSDGDSFECIRRNRPLKNIVLNFQIINTGYWELLPIPMIYLPTWDCYYPTSVSTASRRRFFRTLKTLTF